jgi:predicted nucleic-acid-binding protein
MIAVDTNVLVRFIVRDDARQSGRARRLFERLQSDGEQAYVSDVVLCELVWVLERSYRVTRPEIAAVLARLIRARSLLFDSTERLARAIERHRIGKGDFADYLVSEHAAARDCEHVVTFDRALLREAGFEAP